MNEFTIYKKNENGERVGEVVSSDFVFDPRAVMNRLGITNAYVAEKIGVSPPSVVQMLNGSASASTILRLAYVLGVDPREFFVKEKEEKRAVVETRKEITCPYCSKRFLLLDD